MITKILTTFTDDNIKRIPCYTIHFDYQYIHNIQNIKPTTNHACVDQITKVKRIHSSQHKNKIKKAIKYINGHLTTNLSLNDVAKQVNLSPCYFSKLFKELQSEGFNMYVNQQRMKQAKLLLEMPKLSIATVAKYLGFSQTSYFCRLFRQTYQMTPQTYRSLSKK